MVDPAGQLVPSNKHTACPDTSNDVKLADKPDKLLTNAFVPVALIQFKSVPDAVAKPNHCVEVTRVNTPSTTARFVSEAFVANTLVDVTFVPVTLVKLAAAGVKFPITVPLIAPPVIVAFDEFKFNAVNVVPDAVANPNHPVDVALVITNPAVDVPPAN